MIAGVGGELVPISKQLICETMWPLLERKSSYCPLAYILFLNYILLFMLLHLSQRVLLCPPPSSPLTISGNPHTIVYVHGSRKYVLWLLYSLCCTLHPHDHYVTTVQYFLIPSPFLHIPLLPLLSATIRMFSASCSFILFFRLNC